MNDDWFWLYAALDSSETRRAALLLRCACPLSFFFFLARALSLTRSLLRAVTRPLSAALALSFSSVLALSLSIYACMHACMRTRTRARTRTRIPDSRSSLTPPPPTPQQRRHARPPVGSQHANPPGRREKHVTSARQHAMAHPGAQRLPPLAGARTPKENRKKEAETA